MRFDLHDKVYGDCKYCSGIDTMLIDEEGRLHCTNCNTCLNSVEDYENDEDYECIPDDMARSEFYLYKRKVYTEDELEDRYPDVFAPDYLVYPVCDCGSIIIDDGLGNYKCPRSTCEKEYDEDECKELIRRGQCRSFY